MSISVGDNAKMIQPVVTGIVIDTRYNKDAKQLEHLLEFVGEDGEAHQRWFLESQLEAA